MHTPGHTVGHTCFVINSGGKSLFLTGDLMHHIILIEKPQMEVAFDTDPKQGIQTRIKVMDMLAVQRIVDARLSSALARPRSFRQAGRRVPLRRGADASGPVGPRKSPSPRRGEGPVRFGAAGLSLFFAVSPL